MLKDEEPVVNKEDPKASEDARAKPSDKVKPFPVTIKKSELGAEDESPRKGKRKGDDSDDEEWVAPKIKRKNPKSISCNMCRRKFSSKFGLTAHERMVHKDSRKPKDSEEEISRNAYKMDVTTHPSQTKHNLIPTPTITVNQTTVQNNQKANQPSNQKANQLNNQKVIQPSNQKQTQPSNQKPIQPSNQKETQPSNQKQTQPTSQKQTQPINHKPTQPNNQEPIQKSLLKSTQPGNQKPQPGNQKPSQQNILEPIQPSILKSETTPGNQTSLVQKQPKTVRRDPRQRSKPQMLSQTKTYEAAILPTLDLVNEQVKPTSQLTKTPTQLTPIGTSTKMYVANEESLLLDDFDFDEDEAPLTIDERFETVTVEVGENSKYFDFGDLKQTDALLLDTPVK